MKSQVSPKTWVEIDAAALRHNFGIFQKLAGSKTAIMAVVKANAYGHGLPEVVKILSSLRSETLQIPPHLPFPKGGKQRPPLEKEGAGGFRHLWFGVDSIDEALAIRGLGVNNPILILGYIPSERLKETIENNISFPVYSKKLLAMITKKQWAKNPRMHLKIETGTNRLGVRFGELAAAVPLLKEHADWVEGVYTHFADTENPQSSFWKEQCARFEEAIAFLKKIGVQPIRHAASSAAALLYSEARYDMIRTGIGLYGLWPSSDVKHRVFNNTRPLVSRTLKPVLTWKTRIAQIKKIKKGATVGYDRTFKAPREMIVAILPIGYWDGYDRRFSNNGEVLVSGRRAPIAGRICMNMIMVDITYIKNARERDEAVLLGKQKKEEMSAEELAEKIGTINYEIIARINPSIPRVNSAAERIIAGTARSMGIAVE